MTEQPHSSATDGYPLGRSDAETHRLIAQNQLYGPLTRQFLTGAGITAGMRVLDLGSGAGDVALLVADIVGPQGTVVGVDNDPGILETARDRVRAAGWTTVEFHEGDIGRPDLEGGFDAVVGRWILMYVKDPVDVLRRAAALLRSGGIVAFQEMDLSEPPRTYPSTPLHARLARLMVPPAGASGPDVAMGMKLYQSYLAAGLPAPRLRIDAPIGGGADWPGYPYLADTLRSLLPMLRRTGAVAPWDVAVDTVEDELRAELVAARGVQVLSSVVGAWTRT